MHEAECILRNGKIELRHVSGQADPDVIISQVPADIVEGDWVAVIHDNKWWPGYAETVSTDNQVSITFMKPVTENKFIWCQSH